MLRQMTVVTVLSLCVFGCGDDGAGEGGTGGSGSTSVSTSSGSSSSKSTSVASGSQTATSTGSQGATTSSGSGGCVDANEPNDSLQDPSFVNDASQGLACKADPLSGGGSLSSPTDIDAHKIYTLSQGCEGPVPTLKVTPTSALDVCFYVQDCDGGPALHSCPDGLTYTDDVDQGFASCCETISAETTIRLEDVTSCPDFNFQMYVGLDGSSVAGCNDYLFEVSL